LRFAIVWCFLKSRSDLKEARSQISQHKIGHHLIPMLNQDGISNSVTRLWINHQLHLLSRLLQLIQKLNSVRRVHVVIDSAVYQKKLSMQVLREIHGRALAVTFGIVLWGQHVTLSVDRVIVTPVGDCASRNPNLEGLTMGERIARHESAV